MRTSAGSSMRFRPRMAGEVRRAPGSGPARRAAHPEMAERRRAGGWDSEHGVKRGRHRAAVHRRCWRTSICTTCSTCGSKRGGRSRRSGDVIVVRFADDFVVGFQHQGGCRAVPGGTGASDSRSSTWNCIPRRRACSSSARSRPSNRQRRGEGKPETFNFLGFTHICGKKRSNGTFTVLRQTMRKRLQAKLSEVKAELRRRMHDPIPEVGKWLRVGRRWTRPVLRGAHERPGAAHLSVPSGPPLASHAVAAQPERPCPVGPDAAPHRPLASSCPHLSSLSPAALGVIT